MKQGIAWTEDSICHLRPRQTFDRRQRVRLARLSFRSAVPKLPKPFVQRVLSRMITAIGHLKKSAELVLLLLLERKTSNSITGRST